MNGVIDGPWELEHDLQQTLDGRQQVATLVTASWVDAAFKVLEAAGFRVITCAKVKDRGSYYRVMFLVAAVKQGDTDGDDSTRENGRSHRGAGSRDADGPEG